MIKARKPDFVTFTGIDINTDLAKVLELSQKYRYAVEWGVLFSAERSSEREARYPSRDFIQACRHFPIRKALHLCGTDAKLVSLKIMDPSISPVGFDRVQINVKDPKEEGILSFSQRFNTQCIIQVRGNFVPCSDTIQQLFDCSEGTGKQPEYWPRHPGGGICVGYAGGITPENVIETLQHIKSDGPYWIDMESGVRTDDWLDLSKCEAVLKAVYD